MRCRSAIVLLSLLALAARAQTPRITVDIPSAAPPPNTATAHAAVATRTPLPPLLDGLDSDPIWDQAQSIDAFRQYAPIEDGAASFRTVAKVAYDERYLYVFVRMYDPHPDSIVGLLGRRDQKSQSDWIKILIDSYHDKRTGYEFAVNPRGVKRDIYTLNDGEEDDSWDGIWDAVTHVDSLGWTAEFRIPFDQLRFTKKPQITMGLAIAREIARLNEKDSWPVYRMSHTGIASQFGELSGIDGLGTAPHLEIVPYAVAKSITFPHADSSYGREQQYAVGGDIKWGVTSNLTLDGTVNPDFGQVESDPAVLNLSNFETFLPERRPFFLEGTGIFRFDMNCNMGSCSGLFYSRRIGRQPQLTDGGAGSPTVTSIYGAAKLTGRTDGGLSVGVLDALTAREVNDDPTQSTSEPPTNYFATQVIQEFRDGQTQIGAMVTATNRRLDAFTIDTLRDAAYVGGVHFTTQFGSREYQLSGSVVSSYVSGSPTAMALTQTNSTHYFQRPGSGLVYDTTRTSLTGDAEKISFGKIGGGILRFNTNFGRVSPGLEINDLGYLAEAGVMKWNNVISTDITEEGSFYRQMYLDLGETNGWTTQGLSSTYMNNNVAYVSADVQFLNSWWLHGAFELNRFLTAYDDRKARGGPALRGHQYNDGFVGIEGDPRLNAVPAFTFSLYDGSGGLSHGYNASASVLYHASSSLAVSLALTYALDVDYVNWLANYIHYPPAAAPESIYTIATLHQNTASAIVRIDATFTPRLTLQFYAQPYLSDGRYDNWRKVGDPRSPEYSKEYVPYVPDSTDNPNVGACTTVMVSCYNFDYQQLNVNAVLRWEYRRGSTLYVVWTHGRTVYNYDQAYSGFSPGSDVNSMFSVHPMNTFEIKATYWFGL